MRVKYPSLLVVRAIAALHHSSNHLYQQNKGVPRPELNLDAPQVMAIIIPEDPLPDNKPSKKCANKKGGPAIRPIQ